MKIKIRMNLFLFLFLKITLENEFKNTKKEDKKIKKWINNIRIYVFFQKYIKELDDELNIIITELNNLSETIKLIRTNNINDSNLKLYFSSDKLYKNHLSPDKWYILKDNYGLSTIFYDNKYIIYKASVYVDIYRTKTLKCQKHLLREEITQSLGLVNDINMDNSIFNQKWQCITKYSKFDKLIIHFFLSKHIQPGFEEKEIINTYLSNNFYTF